MGMQGQVGAWRETAKVENDSKFAYGPERVTWKIIGS